MTNIFTDACKSALRRRRLLGVGLLAALLLTAGIAYASIPDANGVIHGCRKNSGGALRVIDTDAGQTCAGSETALDWNQTGPAGPAGPAGMVGLEYKFQNKYEPAGWTYSEVYIYCSPGKTAIAGGFIRGTRSQDIDVAGSWPNLNPQLTFASSWIVGFFNRSGQAADLFGYAICADMGS